MCCHVLIANQSEPTGDSAGIRVSRAVKRYKNVGAYEKVSIEEPEKLE